MSLKIKIDVKQVEFNGLLLDIPKLSLKHYDISDASDIQDTLDKIIKEIKPNPTSYEYKYIMLQLSAYNGFLKESISINGKEYHIENVYHKKPRDFHINGDRVIMQDDLLISAESPIDVLRKLCVSHDADELPAYALDWAYEIMEDLAIDLDETIYGFDNIQEAFE